MIPRTTMLAGLNSLDPRIEWEDTYCLMCGNKDEEARFEAADLSPENGEGLRFLVVRCRQCGLSYTNPRPSPNSIGQFYSAEYKPHRRPAKIKQARTRRTFWQKLTGRNNQERRGVLPWQGTGRLLDFGCGSGSYLKRMADVGWDVTGLDAAVGAVRHIQEKLGLKAMVGSLPHPDLKPSSFEIITMWHSLEHVHEPLEILREAYQLLIPGGKLIVACPNIDSWPFRHFGKHWFALDLPRHLTHFTPPTLRQMMQLAGLRVESMRTIRHSDWIRSSARLACRHGEPSPMNRLMCWKPATKIISAVLHAISGSDCLIAVAQRPG